MKDWNVENAYRDLFFMDPKLKDNEWIKHMYRSFEEMEDEGERAPPAYLPPELDDTGKRKDIRKSPEHTRISLVDIPDKPIFRILRRDQRV